MEKLIGSKKGKIALAVVLAVVACAILTVVAVNSSKVSQNSKRIMAGLTDYAAVAGMTDGISEETVRNGLDHAQSGWTVKKTSNTKSNSKDLSFQASKAAFASEGASAGAATRPVESDFSWYWDRETQVPAGAKTLTGQDLAGSWKTMAFSTGDDEPVGYYSLFNSDVVINGSYSSLKADWYVSYSFSIEDGEDYYWFDESVDADVRYGGSYISEDNALVVWDDASSFMFISSDYINGFMIDSWYEYDNKQYATGAMFDKNDECIGTVALVRDTAVKVPENDKKEANRKIEDFSYTWWSEDGDEWKDKNAIKISYENGSMSLISYSYFSMSDTLETKDFAFDGKILILPAEEYGQMICSLLSDGRLEVTLAGIRKTYVREDDESVRLRDYLGVWYGVWNGAEGCTVISYYGGKIYYGDYELEQFMKNHSDDAAVVDRYVLGKDMLTIYHDEFRGGYVNLFRTDETHLKSVNGSGVEMDYELLDDVNMIQVKRELNTVQQARSMSC